MSPTFRCPRCAWEQRHFARRATKKNFSCRSLAPSHPFFATIHGNRLTRYDAVVCLQIRTLGCGCSMNSTSAWLSPSAFPYLSFSLSPVPFFFHALYCTRTQVMICLIMSDVFSNHPSKAPFTVTTQCQRLYRCVFRTSDIVLFDRYPEVATLRSCNKTIKKMIDEHPNRESTLCRPPADSETNDTLQLMRLFL